MMYMCRAIDVAWICVAIATIKVPPATGRGFCPPQRQLFPHHELVFIVCT